MEPIFIIGSSDHARVVVDIVEVEGRYSIRGLIDSFKPKGARVGSYEVLGTEHDLNELTATTGVRRGIVGIGDNFTRCRLSTYIRERLPAFEFVTAVHPSAYLSRDARPGPGTIVMGQAFLGIETAIEEGCVISSKASFEHNSVMKPFSSLGAGVTCGGHVHLGLCSALCIGVTALHKVRVGDHTVIGAGALVRSDIRDGVIAYGTPARVIRERKPSDSYL